MNYQMMRRLNLKVMIMKKTKPHSGLILDEKSFDLEDHLEMVTLVIHLKDVKDPIAIDVSDNEDIIDILLGYFTKEVIDES